MNNLPLEYLNDGLNQAARDIPALSPDYVKIDDRDIFQLAQYIYNIASVFNYYNYSDQPDGDWQPFFDKNIHTLNGIIASVDEKKILELYKKNKENINAALNFKELRQAVCDMFTLLISVGNPLVEISAKIDYAQLNIENIDGDVIANYTDLHNNYLEISNLLDTDLHLDFHNAVINKEQPILQYAHTSSHDLRKLKERIKVSMMRLDTVFSVFTSQYSLIKYHLNSNKEGTSQYPAHVSLIITFLRLFGHLQDQINGITKKHLEYYYDNVLKLSAKEAIPDRVYLILELATIVDNLVLDEGTIFIAKPGGNPPNIEYKLLEDTVITKAVIAELKTVYIDDIDKNLLNNDEETIIYSTDNPLNEVKTILKQPEAINDWPLFGVTQRNLSASEQTMQYADLGFIIASPVLYLTEGTRRISIKIFFDPGISYAPGARLQIDESSFIVYITGEKGWVNISRYAIDSVMEERSITISFTLGEEDDAIFQFNPAVHGGDYSLDYPAIKCILNNYGTFKVYPFFKYLNIRQVNITAAVDSYQHMQLQTSLGAVSPGTPFQVFGPIPNVGAYLDIKDTNVFNKYTKDFTIKLEWLDLPQQQDGFTDYYREYDTDVTNDSFRIKIGSVVNGKYTANKKDQEEYYLFKTDSSNYLINETDIAIYQLKDVAFSNGMKMAEEAGNPEFLNGVLRLELIAPSTAFGHRVFPQVFSEAAMENASIWPFKKRRLLPNTPYIPVIKKVTISYTTEQVEVFKTNKPDAELQLVHVYPYGYNNVYPQSKLGFGIIPQFHLQPKNKTRPVVFNAVLNIGFKDLVPGQELSLYIKFSHNNLYKANYVSEPVYWYYLVNNEWKTLEQQNIILDTTFDLIATGIIRMKIPNDIHAGNTILNPDLCWLMAAVENPDNKQFKVIGIYTQVALVERIINTTQQNNNEDYKIPPNSILSLNAKNPKIQSIWQPFTSFGGMKAQTRNSFNILSSERLRHKQRPLLVIDLLQAILGKFPEIIVAKCINAVNTRQVLPGVNIYIVVMRRVNNYATISSNQIEVDIPLLTRIKKYLETITSPFAKIELGNAIYEKIKVVCSVVFNVKHSLSDNGYYTQKLYDDIKLYIAPWITNSDADIKIGSKLNISVFLNYIKNLPYVEYITGFSLIHFYSELDPAIGVFVSRVTDYTEFSDGFIHASAPEAIFYPTDTHIITVLDEQDIKRQEKAGIKNLRVGSELVITSKSWNAEKIKMAQSEDNSDDEQDDDDAFYDFTINI